jgi:hypothetical protein
MARFLGLDQLFEGRHFDREVIVLCMRWYLRFELSFRGFRQRSRQTAIPGVPLSGYDAGVRLECGC